VIIAMSRWANDPEGAADALIERSLDDIQLQGGVLLVNQAGTLPATLAARGLCPSIWNRRKVGSSPASPWPLGGPFDTAVVRVPKARDEQEMTVHAALSVLAPGGRLILYGGNDEGIRSAATMLARVAGTVETIAARGHGRVLAACKPADVGVLQTTLHAWRTISPMQNGANTRDWVSYPGVFAAGRLDDGTALLLRALPPAPAGSRILDYGCGSGVIGATMLAREPGIDLTMLDHDAVALEAARENVPGARLVQGTCLADAGDAYDFIFSNPPLHQGIAEDRALLDRLIADAPTRLKPNGVLQVVVQRRVPLDRTFAEHFGRVEVVAENGRYRIWRAQRA
jgi:16S rRNA (guanine1207-N2)-methyltransferase